MASILSISSSSWISGNLALKKSASDFSSLSSQLVFLSFHSLNKYLADYVQELTEETTQIPENLTYYIDYERMGRDMEMSGDVFTVATGFEEIHIFWNH